jgi:type II secretory pathway pseudopilin PulG
MTSRRRRASGFTLVELLFVAAVTAAILGGGAAALVSRLHADAASRLRSLQNAGTSRVQQQLQQEMALAQRLSSEASDLPAACAGLSSTLTLLGPGGRWRIGYGLRQQGPDSDWQGPAQLLRCGPPYAAKGLDSAAEPIQSVLLDRLQASGGFRASAITANEVTITLQPHSSTGAIPASRFTGRIAGGRAAGAAADLASCSGLCRETDTVNIWRPSGGTIAGDTTKTDILHFPLERARYSLSEPCDRSMCTVTGNPSAVIYNGDVLVFSDQQLRLR